MACDAPQEICMTFNSSAYSLIKHGHAREIGVEECLELIDKAQENHLVQFGENGREGVNFICNCCGCCCEALLAIKRFALAQNINSNYIIEATQSCTGCGKCIKVCPVNALEIDTARSIDKLRFPNIVYERCIGCGVCARACPSGGLLLKARATRSITPMNTAHRVVLMATEQGTLGQLLQDNNAQASYRIMAAVIGSLVKSPGKIRDMAVKQLKSRYLESFFAKL